jgi:hypothetical protein
MEDTMFTDKIRKVKIFINLEINNEFMASSVNNLNIQKVFKFVTKYSNSYNKYNDILILHLMKFFFLRHVLTLYPSSSGI